MAEGLINQEIALALSNGATGVPGGRVCDATLAEWNEFQKSDIQALKSSRMERIHGTIYIVELPSPEHDRFVAIVAQLLARQDVVCENLEPHLAGYRQDRPDDEPKYEADQAYGPMEGGGSRLPRGITNYNDWHTLIVEVGYARRWAGVPGVRYILCVAVTDRLATAEYKLYTVFRPRRQLPAYWGHIQNPNEAPAPIVAPRTEYLSSFCLFICTPRNSSNPNAHEEDRIFHSRSLPVKFCLLHQMDGVCVGKTIL